jgi:stage III sporulation protein AG
MDIQIKQLTKYIKDYKWIALVLVLGLVLMLIPDKQTKPETVQPQTEKAESNELELEAILSQIQGVGKVRVLLTVSQGERTIYVYDEDTSDTPDSGNSRREAVLITDGSRAQSGLVSQVLPPVYLGAVVVCQGGDLPGVRLAVVEAVSAATGLTADKISVLKMK